MSTVICGDGSTKIEVMKVRKDYLVRVWSAAKKGLISSGWVNHKDDKVALKVAILGGALAERQNEMYMDRHDPDAVANSTAKAFRDLQAKLAKEEAMVLSPDAEIIAPYFFDENN